ncbi:MAG TPA: hypothetical protein PL040_03505, partial [Bacteroidales bacterium]|nr:hypothetical protein [Bacteroidales bacterium]
ARFFGQAKKVRVIILNLCEITGLALSTSLTIPDALRAIRKISKLIPHTAIRNPKIINNLYPAGVQVL